MDLMEKKNNLWVVAFIILIIIGMGVLLAMTSNKKTGPVLTLPDNNLNPISQNQNQAATPTSPPAPTFAPVTELKIEDLKVGTGSAVASGSSVTVHYIGGLTNGKVFDSSVPRKQPFAFKIGEGQVIKGWEEGLIGMKVGGIRRLHIPPQLGYGAQGAGGIIPPNATLIFEIQLLDVK